LQDLAQSVLSQPEASPDASAKLAGQLSQQRELDRNHATVSELCRSALLPGCER